MEKQKSQDTASIPALQPVRPITRPGRHSLIDSHWQASKVNRHYLWRQLYKKSRPLKREGKRILQAYCAFRYSLFSINNTFQRSTRKPAEGTSTEGALWTSPGGKNVPLTVRGTRFQLPNYSKEAEFSIESDKDLTVLAPKLQSRGWTDTEIGTLKRSQRRRMRGIDCVTLKSERVRQLDCFKRHNTFWTHSRFQQRGEKTWPGAKMWDNLFRRKVKRIMLTIQFMPTLLS